MAGPSNKDKVGRWTQRSRIAPAPNRAPTLDSVAKTLLSTVHEKIEEVAKEVR